MTPRINFDNLIRQLLPNHKRLPVRLMILRTFIVRLKDLLGQFEPWRDYVRMAVNVNSQAMVLEGYLRKKYNEPVRIRLVTAEDGLFQVGLIEEGDTFLPRVSLDASTPAIIPLLGEVTGPFEGVDFVVYIPPNLDIDLIRAEIEQYRRATATYRIIQK